MFNLWRDLTALGIAGFHNVDSCQRCDHCGPDGGLGDIYTYYYSVTSNHTADPVLVLTTTDPTKEVCSRSEKLLTIDENPNLVYLRP